MNDAPGPGDLFCWCCKREGADPCCYCPSDGRGIAAHNPPTLADMSRMFHILEQRLKGPSETA